MIRTTWTSTRIRLLTRSAAMVGHLVLHDSPIKLHSNAKFSFQYVGGWGPIGYRMPSGVERKPWFHCIATMVLNKISFQQPKYTTVTSDAKLKESGCVTSAT